MHPDLERVVRLQRIEDAAERARRTIADEPARQEALAAALDAARQALETQRALLAENQTARRDAEKELAVQQARLSKYRDQLMEVKTNREYQALQKEIEVAQQEIRKQEDALLERMIEFDEVRERVRAAEEAFERDRAAFDAGREALAAEVAGAGEAIGTLAAERAAVAAELSPPVLALFERVLRHRRTSAVAPLRDGRCAACQVRIRPQTVQEIRRNDSVVQCESCQRILYLEAPAAEGAAADAGASGAASARLQE
ncbi:MAG TPA: C4-type zinc ribbon domain-containing protein [Vicinamibacterales bacterium]|nr:C4-type zinc ribbon domain-containing protein [Vicinamibacterales bacterium]HOG28941.1 C4-type zinc ribbon domain-containing protein [Vicinamibacterales bacterium]HOQ59920.1 C4-type zinc ribbon domain-containing protein [Vicinamibacterales bacterium]